MGSKWDGNLTKWQASRIRSGIELALGKKSLKVLELEVWVSPDLDRIIMDYADGLVRNSYYRTRIRRGDPDVLKN